jgi:hypothetical protein
MIFIAAEGWRGEMWADGVGTVACMSCKAKWL